MNKNYIIVFFKDDEITYDYFISKNLEKINSLKNKNTFFIAEIELNKLYLYEIFNYIFKYDFNIEKNNIIDYIYINDDFKDIIDMFMF